MPEAKISTRTLCLRQFR